MILNQFLFVYSELFRNILIHAQIWNKWIQIEQFVLMWKKRDILNEIRSASTNHVIDKHLSMKFWTFKTHSNAFFGTNINESIVWYPSACNFFISPLVMPFTCVNRKNPLWNTSFNVVQTTKNIDKKNELPILWWVVDQILLLLPHSERFLLICQLHFEPW